MITRAQNWRGTGIRAIAGTRGLGQDSGNGAPDVFSPAELASLVPAVGPNAPGILQVGNLATQISSGGGYSLNPSTGQLQANLIPGISNAGLLWIGGALVGVALLAGIARGRR